MDIVSCVEPLPVTEGGLKLQLLSAGSPEQEAAVKLSVPVKPPWALTVIVSCTLPPGAEIVGELGLNDNWKFGCTVSCSGGDEEVT